MAYDDIAFFSNARGGPKIEHFPMISGASFGKGDVVLVVAAGTLREGVDGTGGNTAPGQIGIALGGPNGPAGTTLNNPVTDLPYAAGAMIPVAVFDTESLWITKNYSAAGTAFDDTAPAVADIGDEAGLVSISGVWGLDNSPDSPDATARIIDILDSTRTSLQPPAGGTAATVATTDVFYVVFSIVAHQGTPDSGEAVAPIS